MTLKTASAFMTTVSKQKLTVVSFSEFLVVFGGKLAGAKYKGKPKTQRDAFVRWVRGHRQDLAHAILLPEIFEDWSDFDTYSDLILFEKDLSYLTSVVLVFLEGQGAIAELGAFSQIGSLRERLLVVIAEEHSVNRSFITLGPIRSIRDTHKHSDAICVIPVKKLAEFQDHIPAVVKALDEKRKRPSKSVAFNADDEQHRILLVLDLVTLFLTLQIGEIEELALHFGVSFAGTKLKQILFVLVKTGLVIRKEYGNNVYYVPKDQTKNYVDYNYNGTGEFFKRPGAKAKIWNEVKSDVFRRTAFELARGERMSG